MDRIKWGKAGIFMVVCLAMLGIAFFIFQEALHPEDGINRGLDISGGVYILLEAVEDPETEEEVDRETVERAMSVIRQRVDELGVAEPLIQLQGERRIRIELPGYQDEREAREVIGRTAQLEFRDPDGEIILTGEHMEDARAERMSPYQTGLEEPAVTLELDSEGQEKFAEATSRLTGEYIAIYLDEEELSSPLVQETIAHGSAYISGIESMDEASHLAMMLRAGSLPVTLEEQELMVTGPQLGEDMESVGVWAAGAGLFAVLLFLVFYYRSVGGLAGIIMVFYLSLVLGALNYLGASLTLPGIAGIILSIGMAVDANIIIFERIKEELRSGRRLRVSIEAGFERAFKTILDANITTIIAAIILFAMADGPVRGFAVTLIIGLVLSVLSALVIARFLLRLGYQSKLLRAPSQVGVTD